MANMLGVASAGQERKEVEGAQHLACTIEMVNMGKRCDVAVIDEIQMIGDESRGWAWTRALQGVPANEIHLCGDASALPLVRNQQQHSRRSRCVLHSLLWFPELALQGSVPGDSSEALQRVRCVAYACSEVLRAAQARSLRPSRYKAAGCNGALAHIRPYILPEIYLS